MVENNRYFQKGNVSSSLHLQTMGTAKNNNSKVSAHYYGLETGQESLVNTNL
jgi:hypothetical protein